MYKHTAHGMTTIHNGKQRRVLAPETQKKTQIARHEQANEAQLVTRQNRNWPSLLWQSEKRNKQIHKITQRVHNSRTTRGCCSLGRAIRHVVKQEKTNTSRNEVTTQKRDVLLPTRPHTNGNSQNEQRQCASKIMTTKHTNSRAVRRRRQHRNRDKRKRNETQLVTAQKMAEFNADSKKNRNRITNTLRTDDYSTKRRKVLSSEQ